MQQEVEMAVCALQRSGHHAVMDWLMAVLRGRYGAGSIRYVNWVNQFMPQLDPFNTNTHPTDDSHKCGPKDRSKPRKILIYNFEDCGMYMMRAMEFVSKQFNGESDMRYNVIILRDFYNMLASRMERTRKGKPFDHPYNSLVGLWIEYAETFRRKGSYGDSKHGGLSNLLAISYNKWFSSKEYRATICNLLECPYTEETMQRVHLAGEGSSFTGTKGDGRSLDVLSRWKKFKNDEEYKTIVLTPQIRKVNSLIFGWYLDTDKGGSLKVVPYK